MYTTCLERGNELEKGYEVINLNDYGFEWYKDNKLVREGLIEDREESVKMLLEEGFSIVE